MKTQKGITLIALIVTIIVMLILVGVSINLAINIGLFKAAQGAAKNTEIERMNETKLSEGQVTIDSKTYLSMEDAAKDEYAIKEKEGKYCVGSKEHDTLEEALNYASDLKSKRHKT